MASSSTATPETLITLKVSFDGVTRRFKLPLRELVVSTLENKLRHSLQIPSETTATFERYSDSAGSFVVLHPANIPAYKQLYRAAKAKQKLKLRVTTQKPEPEAEPEPEVKQEAEPACEPEEVKAPKPVTIEDEPEVESKEVVEPTICEPSLDLTSEALSPINTSAEIGTEVLNSISVSDIHSNLPDFIKLWRTYGMPSIHVRRDEEGKEIVDLVKSTPAVTADALRALESNEATQSSLNDTSRCPFSQSASPLADTSRLIDSLKQRLAVSKESRKSSGLPESYYFRNTKVKEAQTEEVKIEEAKMEEATAAPSCPKRPFTVCCNSCDRAVPDAHFHCSTCDDGDFDLCQDCVNQGITCYGDGHWLIKRTIKDGQINYSSTHVAPKISRPKPTKVVATAPIVNLPIRPAESVNWAPSWSAPFNDRTCNCCVQDFPGEDFLHCTTCDDYDLCKNCFAKNKHGHHPAHGFVPAVKGTTFDHSVSSRLAPGRNATHNAICDGCDKYVRGIRHKCLDCPDWDYCSECVQNADFIHANHRFVAIYEPLADRAMQSASRATHYGICCDGPLCAATHGGSSKCIVGVRYKCAVCHDTDFCANCEASPANKHNKTHPLIKFKTPVRHVSVTTTGEHEDGQRMPTMGDRVTRATATDVSVHESIAATPVQTVVDVQPTEQQLPKPEEKEVEVKKEEVDAEVATLVEKQPITPDLVAVFQHDRVADGTILPPNYTFEQVWVLRNEGTDAWPAGCSVKFVGGDYMGAVDPTHPAGIHELVSASESTICYNALKPGQEFPFTVLMRTPDREGKVISYWRLTTPDGVKFGHKLWCDVTVQAPPKVVEAQPLPEKEEASSSPALDVAESQMIIPKLEHESPSASMHENARSEGEVETETDTLAQSVQDEQEEEDFEDCGEDEEWAESDEGFMTDEEYDILDASDEEYLSEQHKPASKK